MTTPTPPREMLVSWPRRHWRLLGLLILALFTSSIVVWMVERTLKSHNKKRAMQYWLDEKLNADVSLLGDMVVRLNLVRNSRLVFYNVEVEHPNFLFPGKFATIERMAAYSPPWSILGLLPGHLEILFTGLRLTFEENEAGEWSSDGLMRPIDTGGVVFPFPYPKISNWRVDVEEGKLYVRRFGYELELDMEFELTGAMRDGNRAFLRSRRMPFSFGRVNSDERLRGSVSSARIAVQLEDPAVNPPEFVPGGPTQATIQGLPAATLPFFLNGVPLEDTPGVFNGMVKFFPHADAAGMLVMDGQLKEVPLSVFGLSRTEPVLLEWPLRPGKAGLIAKLHMGPTGYGGFDINVPLDARGNPTLLSMRGSVAALDDIPVLLSQYSRWTDWLSRNFPAVEWRAGQWLGFGWKGDNLQLSLFRTTAGMNLKGEADLMNGKVRVAMAPGDEESPIAIIGEGLDAQLLAAKLSQLFPEPFKLRLTGTRASFNWQGVYHDSRKLREWMTQMVFEKPRIDLSASGSWWKGLSSITTAVAAALPAWGGGDDERLREIEKISVIELEQAAIVSEWEEDGVLAVEFRAYGANFGQATGMVEYDADGVATGEFFLAGPSLLIETVQGINPDFGKALSLLANESMGLRVAFRAAPGEDPEFSFPFLKDAEGVRAALGARTEADK